MSIGLALFAVAALGWTALRSGSQPVDRLEGGRVAGKTEETPSVAARPTARRPEVAFVPRAEAAPVAAAQDLLDETLRGFVEALVTRSAEGDLDLHGELRELARRASPEELRAVLAALTELSEDDLAEVEDVHALVERLLDVRFAGFEEAPPDDARVPGLAFSDTIDLSTQGTTSPTDVFDADAKKIYAVFESTEYVEPKVLTKWYRVGDPEPLHFQREAVVPGALYNHVWLSRPDGWPSGEYVVEIYSADPRLDLVATGRYWVGDASGRES